jgi:UDPglucose--hexose-1-phosphate uridylyltransferase
MNIASQIEQLLNYGVRAGLIEEIDRIQMRNSLFALFSMDQPDGELSVSEEKVELCSILDTLCDCAVQCGIIPEDTITNRDLFDTKIMGILTPRESCVVRKFRELQEKDARDATDWFYSFSQNTNYIRMDRIRKNIGWETSTPYGNLMITINLSKPELDPRDIAAAKLAKSASYPKCSICLENVGYAGRVNAAARQNHRVIPLRLNEENWYFQYSPYIYYNEHCIVFSEDHIPMNTNVNTVRRLLEFTDLYPHYFLGSNAGLPIVGGSILSHEHYQGGREILPIANAQIRRPLRWKGAPNTTISLMNWCMSTLRLESLVKEEIIQTAAHIMEIWHAYSDESVDVLCASEINGERVRHNAVTPIARKTADGAYQLDIVLRNNRTTAQYPYGIFHPHEELHPIKKENIGLIEVAGLAILPKRLQTELSGISDILAGKSSVKDIKGEEHPLYKHLPFIRELMERYPNPKAEMLDAILQKEVGLRFLEVLKTCAVFKDDAAGESAWNRFLAAADFASLK